LRLALDSNILIYALDTKAGEKHLRAKEVVAAAMLGDTMVPAQVLGELLSVIGRRRPEFAAAALSQARRWSEIFTIAETSVQAVLAAAEFGSRHKLQFWDSVIWQVAKIAGARILLTEDLQDGLELEGVVAINPLVERNAAALRSLWNEKDEG